MTNGKGANRQHAERILRGEYLAPREILKLAKTLKEERAFGLARRLLGRARRDAKIHEDKALLLEVIQQHALCTYKDPDLPAQARLDCALQILREAGEDLAETRNQETLGLAGAISKRRWELDGQRGHLERALAYYRRGYEQGVASDYGYTAINAAFVLDILAAEEQDEAEEAGTVSEGVVARLAEAHEIRTRIAEVLPQLPMQPGKDWLAQEWWFLVTLGEAYLGLGHHQAAQTWLNKARALPDVPEWEYESTARQLVALVRLQHQTCGAPIALEQSPAWAVVREFLGNDIDTLHSAAIGKVGLALSGGGFRAALFHIGVLARLAELDVLRRVEVLSCVSGGSIIGAHYYLEVRNLLQTKADGEITREDYIDIVKRIERDFLAGVQRNLRMRMLADWGANARMIFQPNYSRTLRLGELYEEEIYSQVADGHGSGPRWLNELFIRPHEGSEDFSPRRDNWRCRAKVPILIINATALNTGHNWQFTASWMGEPPTYIDTEVDSNERLRRMYYTDAPDPHKNVRLGHAVAASSSVPGLSQPIALAGLYPDRTVQLVDGGVHDNQGIAGLLDEDCSVMLVSDASGQMENIAAPSTGLLGVPLRANSILMARVREAQFRELDARHRSGLLRGLMFLHLKKDLAAQPLDWVGCDDPYEPGDQCRAEQGKTVLTRYGIRQNVQTKLAGIRTDLDSFSDMEACALMVSGYRMTEHEFPRSIRGFDAPAPQLEWNFLNVEKLMHPDTGQDGYRYLGRILDVGCNVGFKVWQLSRSLTALAWATAAIGVLLMGVAAWVWWREPSLTLTVGQVTSAILVALLPLLMGRLIARVTGVQKTWTQVAIGIGMASLGFLAARVHLHVFDRIYLRLGRIRPASTPRPAVTPPLSQA